MGASGSHQVLKDLQAAVRPGLLWGLLWGVMLGLSAVRVHADATSELDDAAARAQYAFYTGDTRGLEEVLGLIERLDVPATLAPMKEYYAAYGSWKLAQLYTDETLGSARKPGARGQAAKATQTCLRHVDSALKLDSRLSEVHAIHAICATPAPGLALTSLSLTSCARSKALRTALQLEPDNPRIRLIEMLCSMQSDGVTPAARIEKLRTLVAAFESAPPSKPGKPDWGQAEALLLLGQSYLQLGDPLAARDVIERALVIAPDYRKAQELLQAAATRPK